MATVKGNFGGGTHQTEIDFSKTNEIKCEVCMNDTFEQTLIIKKIISIGFTDG